METMAASFPLIIFTFIKTLPLLLVPRCSTCSPAPSPPPLCFWPLLCMCFDSLSHVAFPFLLGLCRVLSPELQLNSFLET
uniref:Uncharacterized protein n=1 Tax=Sus scrofa TaxID=9823 RepID=A0A4X1VIX8_PIG